jgi:signal transduction histidine kinase
MPLMSRRLPVWAQDALLAAFVTYAQISGTQRSAPEALAALDTVGMYGHAILLSTSGVALAMRRRFPVAVVCYVSAASLVYYLAGYPDGPGWLALFVAIYTLNAYGDERYARWLTWSGLPFVTGGWVLAALLFPPVEPGWLFFRIGTAFLAAMMGVSVRMRRKLIAEAHARAEGAERTREEEARRRVDAERLRIAREVHDTVAHAIAVINVQAGVTAHVLDKHPEQARATLVTIEQTSARALRELRVTLGVLRGADEDGRAPAPGLDRVDELVGIAREAGLDVTVESREALRELPGAVDTAAYRILQESITNVIRHAGPTRVTVALAHGADDLTIRVSDDGRGPADGNGSGRGIQGMQERCELLGGELTAGPRPAGGFEVLARLPVVPA